ncbi:DUF500-domain-containing protein [Aspergillus heteromorphus CBS 117.55]|uniref:DUF500-domain-containing protein n=1 Tax=Aspergillus heteromorphus CBS 117.55 TaxID=1448321 RepID=A0A317VXK8_9EURO|nr:DUF500-domain-containing protein [Aspergillus heteromorphus CBS 117.55]PWY78369.1 DUF500-domain-containing protein [Aspergillus heteromorphus CBS 117.55]
MTQGLHNPFPASLRSECSKAAQILEAFTNPDAFNSPSRTLPQRILTGAKGLAILTVAKAAFLGSVRFGSGILVSRLDDGSWSAPSAIVMVGGGFGGQIGVEVTDFVFILHNDLAVRTFAQLGTVTLGINASLALGTLGRNGEIGGAASIGGAVGVFSYGQTKGVFGGASVEGAMIIESRLSNKRLYGRRVTARELLGGEIPPPEEARELLQRLQSGVFEGEDSKSRGLPDESPAGEITIPIPPELPSGEASERAAELPSQVLPHEASQTPSELPSEGSEVSELLSDDAPGDRSPRSELPPITEAFELPAELPAELPGSMVELSPLSPSHPGYSIQRKPTPTSPVSANSTAEPPTRDV